MATIMIPVFPFEDSFVGNVTTTLKLMGHQVLSPPEPKRRLGQHYWDIVTRTWQRAFPHMLTPAEKWAIDTAKQTSGIDLLLCMTKSFGDEALEAVKRQGVSQAAVWWGDAPANIVGNGLLSDMWDGLFIKDRMAAQKLQGLGLPSYLLHEALNPAIHCRNFETINNSVAVVGNYYGYRQMLVRRLIERDIPVDLFGFKPPRWAHVEIKKRYNGRYVMGLEKSEVFGSALASLNCTAFSEGDSLNCRAFEIAGACGLQLIEDKPAVSECFEPGKEVLVYSSIDDIEAHLNRAQKEPQHAMKVREAGYARAHAEHTYEKRLAVILKTLGIEN